MVRREITKTKHQQEWVRVDKALTTPVFVSYFTDLFYLREAFELQRSLELHGLEHCIQQVPDLKSWGRNTNHKPQFLLQMHHRFPKRPLVWLDADARVRRFPALFAAFATSSVQLAYHTWKRGDKPCSGTVFLGPGEWRSPYLQNWIKECTEHPTLTDQVCMARAYPYPPVNLPEEYCWIYDLSLPDTIKVATPQHFMPVIEHMQASRWVENKNES